MFRFIILSISEDFKMLKNYSQTTFRLIWAGLLLAAVVLGSQAACVAEHYDIYLLAGQSNMDGRGKAADLPKLQQEPMEQAIIYYRNPPFTSNGWQPLKPGYSRPPKFKGKLPSPTFGIEIGFAHAMVKAQPNTKLAIIKGSKGGTNLRSDWMPGEKGNLESQGPQYQNFVETIEMATADLTKMLGFRLYRSLLEKCSTMEIVTKFEQQFKRLPKRVQPLGW